ncbi:MAG: hypothetical protein COY58_08420 [Gammaproteobacteria bacterium CG_4_10_14_0_8_um_filter_38_16]|nr:MAG: hypothetical protein COY58_08420 [Gammaproteobacteria bacterium CG_4_10_14_0_8_um_filter_38_16]PJA03125.1 MAG: hypothetical protein COX72_06825 [Gammaproteobacteria bacterium CG_4_10_14_0_2_um_filter_38_22]PJB09935.1 MAG: hypothetical protein CO120_07450 [Gammaproteobacteria bacterium CG_4_9_14_3_um_filter_38_9]
MPIPNRKAAVVANYIWQPAIIFLFVILNLFYHTAKSDVLWAVGAGSLASSAFIIFSKPSSVSAHPLRLIVAYVVAILCGMLLHVMGGLLLYSGYGFVWISFLASVSVVVCLFLMMGLKIEHPPAVGMALVFVIDLKDYRTSILIIAAITVLVLLKLLLNRQLSDLF